MIGNLPKTLNVNNKEIPIRTDYRVALLILQAFNDVELNEYEKIAVMIECLFEEEIEVTEELLNKAVWFLDGGQNSQDTIINQKRVMDWEQDEQMIFSAINKVAGREIRNDDYLHWWTFLGLFHEIGEGLFSTVVNIRTKKNKGKKLEKHEQEFYKNNKNLVDLKTKYTEEEQKEIDRLKKLLG